MYFLVAVTDLHTNLGVEDKMSAVFVWKSFKSFSQYEIFIKIEFRGVQSSLLPLYYFMMWSQPKPVFKYSLFLFDWIRYKYKELRGVSLGVKSIYSVN